MKTSLKSLLAKASFALVLAVSLTSLAQANEGRVGNGGDGLRIDGQLYVLDLVESGAEQAPYYDPRFEARPEFTQRLQVAVGHLPGLNIEKLSRKLNEVAGAISPVFARAILKTIEAYTWSLVSQSLVDIQDEDSVLEYSYGQLVQLAIRRDAVIRIGRTAWSELGEDQKVALITHEMIYALLPAVETLISPATQTAPEVRRWVQMSSRARTLNGTLFTNYSRRRVISMLNQYELAHMTEVGVKEYDDVLEARGPRASSEELTRLIEVGCASWITHYHQQLSYGCSYPTMRYSFAWRTLPGTFNTVPTFTSWGRFSHLCVITSEEMSLLKGLTQEQCVSRVLPIAQERVRAFNASFDELIGE